MVNVKYSDKYYTFAERSNWGVQIGNIPLDKNKTILYSFIIFVVTFALTILLSFVFYKVGN